MLVQQKEIETAFDDLILGKRSREQISDWARGLREAMDEERLTIEPTASQDRIWRAILYLEGVDLKDSPKTYLHITEDFIAFRKELDL